MKAIFQFSGQRKSKYLEYMTEHGHTNIKLPPKPVVTRWNSWLEAVQQHSEYADLYPGFIDHMIAGCGPTTDLETLQDMLQPAKRKILFLQLKYISIMCEPIKTTLLEFEQTSTSTQSVPQNTRNSSFAGCAARENLLCRMRAAL